MSDPEATPPAPRVKLPPEARARAQPQANYQGGGRYNPAVQVSDAMAGITVDTKSAVLKNLFRGGVLPAVRVSVPTRGGLTIDEGTLEALADEHSDAVWSTLVVLQDAFGAHIAIGERWPSLIDAINASEPIPNILAQNTAAYHDLVASVAELIWGCKLGSVDKAHFESWAKSHSLPSALRAILAPSVAYLSTLKPPVDPIPTAWLSYRVTMSSTSTLCKIALEALGSSARAVFSPLEMTEIEASSAFTVTHGISNVAVAKCHTYLSAINYPFGTWYQGQKARAQWSPLDAATFTRAVKAAMARSLEDDLVEVANDTHEILALAGLTQNATDLGRVVRDRKAGQRASKVAEKYMAANGLSAVTIPDGVPPEMVIARVRDMVAANELIKGGLNAEANDQA